jgi:hypothetical protein
MSYDLRIMFSGLSMYVPQGSDTMHVLLPRAKHVHGDHDGAENGHAPHPGGVIGHQDEHNHTEGGTTAVLDSPVPADTGVDAGTDGPVNGAATDGAAGTATDGATDTATDGAADTETDAAADGAADTADTAEEMEEHFTRLLYDAAYEDPKAEQLSRKYIIRDFDGRMLDLRGLATTSERPVLTIPDEIPSMGKVKKHVDPALVQDGALDSRLAGRVIVGSGAITNCLLGARFNLAGEDQRITVRSEWTVRGVTNEEVDGTQRRPVLPAQPASGLPLPLYPIGETIHLMVFNTTAEEFPPHGPGFDVPMPRSDAHHFAAYYPLTKEGPSDDIPRRISDHDVEVEQDGPKIKKRGPETVLRMTCVQTSGTLAQ